jgi:dTDP-4-dehydrorhamnose reductase
MRAFIAGGTGQLGRELARLLGERVVWSGGSRELDIRDGDAVARVIRGARPNVIFNCAAFNDVDGAEDAAGRALSVNAFAVLAQARAAAAAGAALVHFSSDFVFDGESDRPYTEEDRPNPQGAYAASKLLGDWFTAEAPRAYVLRVESLFGPATTGHGRRGSLGTIVDRIREGAEVPVFVDRVVSPSHTPDIARAARLLVEGEAPPGLYHCVSTGHATWAQVAERAAAELDLPLRMRPITMAAANLRARRPRYCALSNAKLAAAGIEMPTWEEALRDFLRPASHHP